MNAKHTPGPWTHNSDGRSRGEISARCRDARLIVAQVAMTSDPSWDGGEDTANAAFIVRACNSHAELLAALSAILYAHDTDNNGAAMGEAVLCQAFATQARRAILNATGVEPFDYRSAAIARATEGTS